jgi:hypothetical protein
VLPPAEVRPRDFDRYRFKNFWDAAQSLDAPMANTYGPVVLDLRETR